MRPSFLCFCLFVSLIKLIPCKVLYQNNNPITTTPDEISLIKIYPNMIISMNLSIPTTSHIQTITDKILQIGDYISLFIQSNNNTFTLQLKTNQQYQNKYKLSPNKINTINIKLNKYDYVLSINGHKYNQQIINYFDIYSLQPVIINNNKQIAQITDISIQNRTLTNQVITTSKSIESIEFIFDNDNDISLLSVTQSYDSFFGDDVSKQDELIYVIIIGIGILLILTCVVTIMFVKCRNTNNDNSKSDYGTRSYEMVHGRKKSASIVNYVDETPGNHDVNEIKIPLTIKENALKPKTTTDKINNGYDNEGGDTNDSMTPMDVGMNTTLGNDGLVTKTDDNNLKIITGNDNREDSISAYSL